jgi:hypothetical protein
MDSVTSFSNHIKPYFTPCYRAHMIKGFDLWDYATVKSRYNEIRASVEDESMPAPGCGEGVWDQATRDQFLTDFQKWKDGNFTQ